MNYEIANKNHEGSKSNMIYRNMTYMSYKRDIVVSEGNMPIMTYERHRGLSEFFLFFYSQVIRMNLCYC